MFQWISDLHHRVSADIEDHKFFSGNTGRSLEWDCVTDAPPSAPPCTLEYDETQTQTVPDDDVNTDTIISLFTDNHRTRELEYHSFFCDLVAGLGKRKRNDD